MQIFGICRFLQGAIYASLNFHTFFFVILHHNLQPGFCLKLATETHFWASFLDNNSLVIPMIWVASKHIFTVSYLDIRTCGFLLI